MAEKAIRSVAEFLDPLTLLFVGLKLGNGIHWSWWLVLLPSLIKWGLVVTLSIIVFILTEIKKGGLDVN